MESSSTSCEPQPCVESELVSWEVAFEEAVAQNDVEFVRKLVSDPEFPTFCELSRNQVMCIAARKGHKEIVELLLASGCCGMDMPYIKDATWKRKPIHLAASKGHLQVVEILVKAGVDLDSTDRQERTPLHWAVNEGRLDVAVYLIEQGASVTALQADGFTVLHGAAWLGNCDLCDLLISHGADVNQTDLVMGMTPFHCLASACTNLTAFQLFLNAGANINAKTTTDRDTALHMVMYRPSDDVVRFLLQNGADLEAQDISGETPLFRAVLMDNTDMVELLLDYGADIRTRNHADQSLLFIAMQTDSLSPSTPIIQLLINEGFPVHSETWLRHKQWPFGCASNLEICSWLHKLATNPRDLQTLSRAVIRKMLGPNKQLTSSLLPLPQPLQNYVGSHGYRYQS